LISSAGAFVYFVPAPVEYSVNDGPRQIVVGVAGPRPQGKPEFAWGPGVNVGACVNFLAGFICCLLALRTPRVESESSKKVNLPRHMPRQQVYGGAHATSSALGPAHGANWSDHV
jgi:hypothetical protein